MNCPNCGAKLNDIKQKFCELCGFELNLKVKDQTDLINPNKGRVFSRRRCC